MRDVTVTLPAAAQARLQELQLAREAALDAARGANARLNALPRAADQQMRDRLTSERDKHNYKHNQLSQLLSRVQQWLVELSGVTLAPAPPVSVALQDGETLSAALAAVRSEIAALRQHLVAVKSAPLPLEDQEQIIEQYIVRQLSAARPAVAVVRDDQLRVSFRDSVVGSTDDVLALLCWCAPEQVYKALTRAIREQPVRADAMPANERLRRTAKLETELSELEQREEALIMRAAGAGPIHSRTCTGTSGSSA